MEANGYLARIIGLERVDESHDAELRRHRDRIGTIETAQAVTGAELRETKDDVTGLQERMDRMAKAFWAAAATFAGLTLTGIGIIATLLGGH